MVYTIGEIVRVLAPGVFYGQEAKVLQVHQRIKHIDYQLDVQWAGIPRPSWFCDDEVECILRDVTQEEEKR